MENGITVIFGPNSEEGISIVQSISDTYHIPYLFSTLEASMSTNNSYSVNVFPSVQHLTKVNHRTSILSIYLLVA